MGAKESKQVGEAKQGDVKKGFFDIMKGDVKKGEVVKEDDKKGKGKAVEAKDNKDGKQPGGADAKKNAGIFEELSETVGFYARTSSRGRRAGMEKHEEWERMQYKHRSQLRRQASNTSAVSEASENK